MGIEYKIMLTLEVFPEWIIYFENDNSEIVNLNQKVASLIFI